MRPLDLVPIYVTRREDWLDELAATLAGTFRAEIRVRAPWFDPERAFDPSRGQYNSTHLLRQLLSDEREDDAKVLGITSVDLFIPVLTYVFGEAQLDGRAAVVSLHRLRSEVYGLRADEALMLERLKKEAVHELGHTFGLVHCEDGRCVMHSSTYVEEIDLKPAEFCDVCRGAVTAR